LQSKKRRLRGISGGGNGRISKMGIGYIRKMLTMGAKTAIKCNKSCKELDERLVAKNKPYRLRMVARGHTRCKAHGVFHSNYQPSTINY